MALNASITRFPIPGLTQVRGPFGHDHRQVEQVFQLISKHGNPRELRCLVDVTIPSEAYDAAETAYEKALGASAGESYGCDDDDCEVKQAVRAAAPAVLVTELQHLLDTYKHMDRQSADDLEHLLEMRVTELSEDEEASDGSG